MLHLRVLARAGAGEHELEAEELFSVNEQEAVYARAWNWRRRAASPFIWPSLPPRKNGTASCAPRKACNPRPSRWDFRPGESLPKRLASPAWLGKRCPSRGRTLTLEIYTPDGQESFYLGPHAPRLTPKEIDLLHGIWLELSNEVAPEELHHHDVVHFALEHLRADISDGNRAGIVDELKKHIAKAHQRRPAND